MNNVKSDFSIKDLEKSLEKFQKLKDQFASKNNLEALLSQLNVKKDEYKTRFLVKSGQTLKSIPVEEISYFYIRNQLVFLTNKENKKRVKKRMEILMV